MWLLEMMPSSSDSYRAMLLLTQTIFGFKKYQIWLLSPIIVFMWTLSAAESEKLCRVFGSDHLRVLHSALFAFRREEMSRWICILTNPGVKVNHL